HHLQRARMAGLGTAAGHVLLRGDHLAHGLATQEPSRYRRRSGRTQGRRKCDCQYRCSGARRLPRVVPPCPAARGSRVRGSAARELAGRHARSSRDPQQRHAEFHQHRRGGCAGRVSVPIYLMTRVRLLLEFSRPFTLVAPALGFLSGAATAYGAVPREAWHPHLIVYPLIGALMAAVLNAGNNALNQIYDLEIDSVNKPKSRLYSRLLSLSDAEVLHYLL